MCKYYVICWWSLFGVKKFLVLLFLLNFMIIDDVEIYKFLLMVLEGWFLVEFIVKFCFMWGFVLVLI